jgi:hypothetical protein
MTDTRPTPLGEMLASPATRFDLPQQYWGFGGAHGGLVLALLTAAMQRDEPDRTLRSVTAQFHRLMRSEFRVETSLLRAGRTVATRTAQALTTEEVDVTATGVFAHSAHRPSPTLEPPPPPVPRPSECPIFTIPPELVPFGQQVEIRPVGAARPFTGGNEPELTAWIRLLDEEPVSLHRFIVLVDALAPSYAAVLSHPVPIPTVELTVRPADGLGHTTSPWVLLRATTLTANRSGWIDEHIDAWSPDGTYLGSAHQLRVILDGQPTTSA